MLISIAPSMRVLPVINTPVVDRSSRWQSVVSTQRKVHHAGAARHIPSAQPKKTGRALPPQHGSATWFHVRCLPGCPRKIIRYWQRTKSFGSNAVQSSRASGRRFHPVIGVFCALSPAPTNKANHCCAYVSDSIASQRAAYISPITTFATCLCYPTTRSP